MADTAVVTGASGFIGTHLVDRLRADGYHVIGLDRRGPSRTGAGVDHLRTDLAQPDDTARSVLRGADVVFHLAGCPGVRTSDPDVEHRRWRDNVRAGQVVLSTVPADVTTVVVSSSSVYGGAGRVEGRPLPCRETDRPSPRGGYARSKLVLEHLCRRRMTAGGHVAIARPFTVAGEGQRADMAVSIWLEAAMGGRPLKVLGSLSRTRDVTDVRDVVEGLVRMAERGVATTVNLGTGRSRTLQEIVHAVVAAARVPVRLDVERNPHDEPTDTLADTGRCRRLLGFVPATDLDALIARQAATMAAAVPQVVTAS